MEDKKKKFLAALKQSDSKQDEVSVGEGIGLTEAEIDQALDELVMEGKLERQSFGICSYRVTGR